MFRFDAYCNAATGSIHNNLAQLGYMSRSAPIFLRLRSAWRSVVSHLEIKTGARMPHAEKARRGSCEWPQPVQPRPQCPDVVGSNPWFPGRV